MAISSGSSCLGADGLGGLGVRLGAAAGSFSRTSAALVSLDCEIVVFSDL